MTRIDNHRTTIFATFTILALGASAMHTDPAHAELGGTMRAPRADDGSTQRVLPGSAVRIRSTVDAGGTTINEYATSDGHVFAYITICPIVKRDQLSERASEHKRLFCMQNNASPSSQHIWTRTGVSFTVFRRVVGQMQSRQTPLSFATVSVNRGGLLEAALRSLECPVGESTIRALIAVLNSGRLSPQCIAILSLPPEELDSADIVRCFELFEDALALDQAHKSHYAYPRD